LDIIEAVGVKIGGSGTSGGQRGQKKDVLASIIIKFARRHFSQIKYSQLLHW
jgi:hypothetical protein